MPRRRDKLGTLPLEQVFALVGVMNNGTYQHEVEVDGKKYLVRTGCLRLQLFKKNSTCVKCGRQGTHFVLEQDWNHNRPHLNLYAGDVLMTKDHIVPKSKGGSNGLKNLQTMCAPCNQAKGNKL